MTTYIRFTWKVTTNYVIYYQNPITGMDNHYCITGSAGYVNYFIPVSNRFCDVGNSEKEGTYLNFPNDALSGFLANQVLEQLRE